MKVKILWKVLTNGFGIFYFNDEEEAVKFFHKSDGITIRFIGYVYNSSEEAWKDLEELKETLK